MKKGYGAPTSNTMGEIGEKYLDLSSGEVYECTNVIPTERDMGFVSTYELYSARFTWVKSSGDCDWNTMKNKPFYSEGVGKNLFERDTELDKVDGWNPGDCAFYIKNPGWINLNKRYDITIRGDVYRNICFAKHHTYYNFAVCGSYRPDYHDDNPMYPFGLVCGWPDEGTEFVDRNWDADGNWIGTPETAGASFNYPQLQFDPEKYPDLRPEEVVITEAEVVHTIDPKYLPNVVFTIKSNVTGTGEVIDRQLVGSDFNTILTAVKNGVSVTAIFNTVGIDGFGVGRVVGYSNGTIWVYCDSDGYWYGIHPDNTVVID